MGSDHLFQRVPYQALSLFLLHGPGGWDSRGFHSGGAGGRRCLLHQKTITGNTATEITLEGFTVYTPDAVRVTVTQWSLPGRRLRMVEIIPGVYEQWSAGMLASFPARSRGLLCLSLPYGTLELTIDNHTRRFEPRSKTAYSSPSKSGRD